MVYANLHFDRSPDIHRIAELPVIQPVDNPAHAFLSIVLHMAHIGAHHVEAVVIHHFQQFLPSGLVRRHLRLEIGHVLRDIAARVSAGGQCRLSDLFQQHALIHQLHIVDQHTFFVDMRAVGRGTSGGAPADIGVMATGAQPKRWLAPEQKQA